MGVSRFFQNVFALILTLGTIFYSSGCATSLYLVKLGRGQAGILCHSRSVEEVLKDPAVEESIKEKIRLVLEAKAYGEAEIGLAKTSNFQRFYQVEGSVLLYAVSACPKDRLEPYEWWFPITGRVTTKGFFSYKDALREREKLTRRGLDVFIQGAQAYSTLGWFQDPIFSSTLGYDPAMVVNVVLHELTHNTVFFKDHLDFNEQIAFFVGGQGAIDFIGSKLGIGSPMQKRAMGILEDGVLFSRFIMNVSQRLKDLYSRPVSLTAKLRERELLFQQAKEEFSTFKRQLRTDFYLGFERVELNNAAILAFGRYVADIERIQKVYERFGRNLKRTVMFLRKMKESGIKDPEGYLANWLNERESEGSKLDVQEMLMSSS